MARKGMGYGTGRGYKNIAGSDPKIHSQSAKGIKQPQKVQPFVNTYEMSEEKKRLLEHKDDHKLFSKLNRGDVRIYDEGRDSNHIDRYTIIIKNSNNTFEVYGMSENPNSVNGYNQSAGTFSKQEISNMLENIKMKKVKSSNIPYDIFKAVKERL